MDNCILFYIQLCELALSKDFAMEINYSFLGILR